ncbi:MAG: hypothetical protein V4565_08555 [Bacteroidota bacterium]
MIKKLSAYLPLYPSIIVIVLACLTIIQIHLNLVKYRNDDVIKWDVTGYYSYLPATFIDKDVTLSFISPENKSFYSGTRYAYSDDLNGNHLLKYPMGMSVLYAPFFLKAHVLTPLLGYPQDGFSDIYEMFIEFSGLFYLLFGLWYLRKLLLCFYSEKVVALTLTFVFFGTNLLYYATVEPAMSHAYTFSLFSIFLYFSYGFYQKVSWNNTIIMAVCFGLIILVRPLNVLFILVFILFGITSLKDLKQRISFFSNHIKYLLTFLFIVFLIILPQFLYYKHVTGNYFVFSYGDEKFYFNQFHLFDFLFGFRKGWLVYTPIMAFAIYGIWCMTNQIRKFRFVIVLLLLVYVYLLSSWWCWWYGGSFSQRAMIDLYPLLSLTLAALLFQMSDFNKLKKGTIYAALFFCLFLNIFQTVQYKYNIIDYDGMTAKEYFKVFGSIDPSVIDTTLLDKPDYEQAVKGMPE